MALSPILTVITRAAIAASKGLLRDFGEVDRLQVSRKGASNFVTNADIRTEKLLREALQKARPDYSFLMEESGETLGKDTRMWWVVDPLDGTSNFIHAVPYFCISIGVEKKLPEGGSELVAATIYDPLRNELFHAEKGGGAFLNDVRIRVSARETLDECMLVTGQPKTNDMDRRNAIELTHRMHSTGASIRHFGATALDLANLAAGRYDGCWYTKAQPWDVAAGMLLIQEAGGMVTEFDGTPATPYSANFLASNRRIHQELVKRLAPQAEATATSGAA